MDPLWQTILVGIIFLASVVYLVIHFWRRRANSGCASCKAMHALRRDGPQMRERQTTGH
jgi:hypothetical protein